MFIQRSGAQVSLAENGQVAVNMARHEDFDVILMDMQMPVMGGLEATACLREFGCKTPIVALTANALKSDRKKYIEAGANDYLTKPLDLDKFYEMLTLYLYHNNKNEGSEQSVDIEPALDEVEAQKYAYLDDPEFRELVEEFLSLLPTIVSEISDAAGVEDWETLHGASHRLKGSGGSYGFPQLTLAAKDINDAVKAANYVGIPELVAVLESSSEKILQIHRKRKAS
jgi:CheY-like chemotaxis protein/HPt (histidine-containing phosphotransfer) domain-containing protein